MQEPGQSTSAGPGVCPFVALVGNRDRRADGPDPDNRCYAEPAPRKRDDRYQADFCYSTNFSTCSVFLAWAARNAAEPTYITEAARKAWGTGIAVPEDARDDAEAAGDDDGEGAPGTPEGGLFGAAGASDADENEPRSSDSFDWVPATAWAEAPYDERAEAEADELAAIEELEADEVEADEVEADEDDELGNDHDDEATTAPKVPAALPMRKRKRPLQPIRTRGSGEWFYADPPDRKPLVTRRYGVAPPVLLGVLGVLVAALVIFMIPTLLSSGDGGGTAVAASPSAGTTRRPAATRVPVAAATASPAPSPKTPKIRNYRVRFGDTVTGIAEKFGVRPTQLQCMNLIRNKNLIVIGDRLQIPPDGFVCPPRWRQATPAP